MGSPGAHLLVHGSPRPGWHLHGLGDRHFHGCFDGHLVGSTCLRNECRGLYHAPLAPTDSRPARLAARSERVFSRVCPPGVAVVDKWNPRRAGIRVGVLGVAAGQHAAVALGLYRFA